MLLDLHVLFAGLTLLSFFTRGVWMLAGSSWLYARPTRILPHVIDTLLFVTAIGRMMQIHEYPGTTPWLTAKLIAVLVYIGLGEIALRRARDRRLRAAAWFAALFVFAYIVLIAISHRPFPLFDSPA